MAIAKASLKGAWAVPCIAISSYQRAVWDSDDIMIIARVGKRYLCRVIYGAEGYRITFYTWLPKKWLRRKDQRKFVTEGKV